jgi:HSP20 family protein
MRYRKLSYRYTAVRHHTITWPVSLWRREVLGGVFDLQGWRPDADVRESASAIEIVVDVAGVEEEKLEIQLFEDAIVVEGERRLGECGEGVVYHVAGVRQGPFRLELPLPVAVDPAGVEARYERGVLYIALRKAR